MTFGLPTLPTQLVRAGPWALQATWLLPGPAPLGVRLASALRNEDSGVSWAAPCGWEQLGTGALAPHGEEGVEKSPSPEAGRASWRKGSWAQPGLSTLGVQHLKQTGPDGPRHDSIRQPAGSRRAHSSL